MSPFLSRSARDPEVAKRVSRGQAYHPTRSRPRWPEDHPARVRRHDPQLRSHLEPSRHVAPEWNGSQDSGVLVLAEPLKLATLFPAAEWGPTALASTRGQCGAGGRAFRGLTRSATEWSAARRKPVRAAAMHPGAAISADVKARRLPTSGRRERNGDIPHFPASRAKGDRPDAGLSPFARK